MDKIELLAPAGDLERLYAAVQSGASGIYMGGSKFSARAYAGNFGNEEIKKAVEYCHLYNAKVYITVNTLIKEYEMDEAFLYVNYLFEIGVDAVIVQDPGLIYRIKKEIPGFEIHASTQMTIHNGDGAILLTKAGIQRVVLSRECSFDEIEYISKDLGIETEIFIHGALCICYSGQCLMSSMIGGRSGNRGRCAQPCRLPFALINKNNGKEEKGYLLSPKDICTIEDVKRLKSSGTSSLKIEGRMKRPEYVAGVVSIYKKALEKLDLIENSSEIGTNTANLDIKEDKKKLLQLFNREGFSKAYLHGNSGKDMMAYSYPKNTGILLGTVQNDLTINLQEDLNTGDGIRIGEEGFTVSSIIKSNKEILNAKAKDIVKLKPLNYKAFDVLYKTSDENLNRELSSIYKSPFERKIDCALKISFEVNKPITLETSYEGINFKLEGDIVSEALKKPVEKEKLEENLSKSGDTPFRFSKIEFNSFESGFLPVSSINKARRELIEKIETCIISIKNKNISNNKNEEFSKNSSSLNLLHNEEKAPLDIYELIVVQSKAQLNAALDKNVENIAVNLFNRYCDINLQEINLENKSESNLFLKVPNIVKGEFETLVKEVESYLPYVKGIITANLGVINRFHSKTQIIGDYKLNLYNSYASEFYKTFVNSSTLSVELNKKDLSKCIKNIKTSFNVLIYGKIELMVSEYCPIGSVFGSKSMEKSCNNVCRGGEFILKDRMGEEFSIKTDRYCRSYIYNNVPLNLITNLDELKKIGVSNFRMDFVDENYEETIKIIEAFRSGQWSYEYTNFTRGHFKRGVE